LGSVYQTLKDPIVISEIEKNGEKIKLYSKSFEGDKKTQIVVSVVVNIENTPVSISTHRRDLNNALNIIKKGSILYEKGGARTVDTRTFNSSSSEERQPTDKISHTTNELSREIETARKAGYVQGVCECVAAIGDDYVLGKKLLTEMNINRDIAKKFANPETYKKLEQGIFKQTQ